jgi:hypothetical protein
MRKFEEILRILTEKRSNWRVVMMLIKFSSKPKRRLITKELNSNFWEKKYRKFKKKLLKSKLWSSRSRIKRILLKQKSRNSMIYRKNLTGWRKRLRLRPKNLKKTTRKSRFKKISWMHYKQRLTVNWRSQKTNLRTLTSSSSSMKSWIRRIESSLFSMPR